MREGKCTGYTFSTVWGDDRVWVTDNGVYVGWVQNGTFVPFISEEDANRMLREALARKRN